MTRISSLSRGDTGRFEALERLTARVQAPWPLTGTSAKDWLSAVLSPTGEECVLLAGANPGEEGFLRLGPSPWDSAVLGSPVWKVTEVQAWSQPACAALLSAARDKVPRTGHLFGRADAGLPGLESALAIAGLAVVEKLRLYGTEARDWVGVTSGPTVRTLRPNEAGWAADLAARAANPLDRYHRDPVLAPKADAFLNAWVRGALNGFCDRADVVEIDGHPAGFALWHARESAGDAGPVARLVLGAVDPAFRGHGAYRALTAHGGSACLAAGAHCLAMATQLGNVAAEKSWTRLGLRPLREWRTFAATPPTPGNGREGALIRENLQ